MEDTFLNPKKDRRKDKSQFAAVSEDFINLEIAGSKLKGLLGSVQSENAIASTHNRNHSAESWFKESFLQKQCYIDLTFPKYSCFVSLDEKYLQRYLEFVQFRTANYLSVVGGNLVVNPKLSKMEVLFESLLSDKQGRKAIDFDSFLDQCPSPTEGIQWSKGKSGGNAYQKTDACLGRVESLDLEEAKCSNSVNPLSGSNMIVLQNQEHGSERLQERPVFTSSMRSLCSDHTSSVSTGSHGVLHCLRKNGNSYFTFSIDDYREIYTANLFKIESSDHKNLDYMYVFHSKMGGLKEHSVWNDALEIVGKMEVSSSLRISSDNSKLMETEFVLYGIDAKRPEEVRAPGAPFWKRRVSSKSVIDMFKMNHKVDAKIDVSSSKIEDTTLEPCPDMLNKIGGLDRTFLVDTTPNLELAAIIVKDHLHKKSPTAQSAGWGLKFLGKGKAESSKTPLEDANVSLNDCSTSMYVLLPAGFHGGPRTNNGGPSGLTERWRSGGQCDCGGWDICCPLTVLNSISIEEFFQSGEQEDSATFDLYVEDSKQGKKPSLKITNSCGSYRIQFQSHLSALQSFSIALAILHAKSFTQSSGSVQKLKL